MNFWRILRHCISRTFFHNTWLTSFCGKNTDRILLKILSEMYRRTGKSYYSLEECHLDTDTDKIGFSEVCAFQVLLFILCWKSPLFWCMLLLRSKAIFRVSFQNTTFTCQSHLAVHCSVVEDVSWSQVTTNCSSDHESICPDMLTPVVPMVLAQT